MPRFAACLLLALLLASCHGSPRGAAAIAARIAAPERFVRNESRLYDRKDLFDLVDGQAESYFAYGFQQVAIVRYRDDRGNVLEVDVWQLATPADAYGLFAASCAGTAIAIGNDGDVELGHRLAFWQDRYFVLAWARQELAPGSLEAAARATAALLPQGGERPALLARLPENGHDEQLPIYFHEYITIRSELWLGEGNPLQLSMETNAVMARYAFAGTPARLVLVQYPRAGTADLALQELRAAPANRPVAARVRGSALGAVFGKVDEATADTLLQQALGE
jgi:hypothetical protein